MTLGHASPRTRRAAADFTSISRKGKTPTEERDEELFTVPDLEAPSSSSSKGDPTAEIHKSGTDGVGVPGKVRRGRNPQDREYRRLKRLLRNRVSAQQARERKKVYVNDLESRADELQVKNLKLEEKISTLINENTVLRKVLMNMRPKADEGAEQNDKSCSIEERREQKP